MISLEDPRWSELGHCYGDASDIPALLRALASTPGPTKDFQDEPWYSLWSSLCHQGDVYTASYAAVPHIVEIALRSPGPIDFSFFQLPSAIELARFQGRGPEIPADLEGPYRDSIKQLVDCVANHRHEDWDSATLLTVITALAVAKGHCEIASALFILDSDTIARINAPDFLDE